MNSEPCAYWFTEETFAALPRLLKKKKVAKLTALIQESNPVEPSEDGLDSVMMADLINSLTQLGVSFPEHGFIGNRGRGVPGVAWVTINRALAGTLVVQLRAIVAEKGYEAIATYDPLKVFVPDTDSARRGVEYLQRALSLPEPYMGLIIRLN